MLFPAKLLKKEKGSDKRGVLVLIAILITSVVVTLALALASVTVRQLELAAGAKPANTAFYAADAGVNCALYWDLRHPLYGESLFKIKDDDSQYTYTNPNDSDEPPVSCYNFDFAKGEGNSWVIANVGGSWETDFNFTLDENQANVTAPCVLVNVRKEWSDNAPANGFLDPGEVRTIITGTGYSSCDSANARRAQRVIEQIYQ